MRKRKLNATKKRIANDQINHTVYYLMDCRLLFNRHLQINTQKTHIFLFALPFPFILKYDCVLSEIKLCSSEYICLGEKKAPKNNTKIKLVSAASKQVDGDGGETKRNETSNGINLYARTSVLAIFRC